VLCCAVLCCAVLCCAVLCCAGVLLFSAIGKSKKSKKSKNNAEKGKTDGRRESFPFKLLLRGLPHNFESVNKLTHNGSGKNYIIVLFNEIRKIINRTNVLKHSELTVRIVYMFTYACLSV